MGTRFFSGCATLRASSYPAVPDVPVDFWAATPGHGRSKKATTERNDTQQTRSGSVRCAGPGVPGAGERELPSERPGRSVLRSGDRRQALGEPSGVALLRPGQRLEPLGDLLESLVAAVLAKPGYISVYS